MKKIAVISHGLSGGGAERVSAIVANYFAENNYDVLFVAAYSSEREYYLDERIKYIYIETKSNNGIIGMLERSFGIKKQVKNFKADIAFSFITNELIPLELSGIPVIPSLRIDPKSTERNFIRKNIRLFVYHHAKNVIFQTEQARDYFDESIRKKGIVIGNPIKENLPYWQEEGHKKVFITACRITKQKNIPMLIDSFIEFHKDYPDYKLELYGDGEPESYKEELEQYCVNKNADSFISFMGHSSQIHSVMSTCEAFFLTSDFEGLSNSMLEAMAIGVPCVCTNCPPGGAELYMKDGAGILIDVGDGKALTKAMYTIAESQQLREKLSKKEKFVRQILQKDTICRQWETLI